MNCCEQAKNKPQLSYSVVSKTRNWFDDPLKTIIEPLKSRGICVLTIVIEHPDKVGEKRADGGYPVIDIKGAPTEYTPDLEKTEELIKTALQHGMHVRIVPHVDAPPNADPPRLFHDIVPNPRKDYYLKVIKPLLETVIKAVKTSDKLSKDNACIPCISFTLGAELDQSLRNHGEYWLEMAGEAYNLIRKNGLSRQRIQLGHKVNHDFTRKFPTTSANYLSVLDYVSVSFYPNLLDSDVTEKDWLKPKDEGNLKKLSALIGKRFMAIKKALRDRLPETNKLCVEIGEAGIGWTDLQEPYKDPPAATGDDTIDIPGFKKVSKSELEKYKHIRKNYYRALLQFLRDGKETLQCKNGFCYVYRPLALWNNHYQYDFLCLMTDKGKFSTDEAKLIKDAFKDDEIAEEIKKYGNELLKSRLVPDVIIKNSTLGKLESFDETIDQKPVIKQRKQVEQRKTKRSFFSNQ